jgi:hypothetical protein
LDADAQFAFFRSPQGPYYAVHARVSSQGMSADPRFGLGAVARVLVAMSSLIPSITLSYLGLRKLMGIPKWNYEN